MIGKRQVAGQQPRFGAGELEAKPVVAGTADLAVVEILDIIGPGGHQDTLHTFAVGKRKGLRLLGSVVGFLLDLEMKMARPREIQRPDSGQHGNPGLGGPGSVTGKGVDPGCCPGFTPAGATEDRVLFDDRSQAQDIPSRHRSPVNQEDIRVQGMEHFSPVGGGRSVYAEGIGLSSVPAGSGGLFGGAAAWRFVAAFQLPAHRHPAVGRQRGGTGDGHRKLTDFAATQVEGLFPPAVGLKGNLDWVGAGVGGDRARSTGKNDQEGQKGR